MTSPSQTTTGAAHARARVSLADALDERLAIDETTLDNRRFALLARIVGCKYSEVRERYEKASLGELEEWREKVSKK